MLQFTDTAANVGYVRHQQFVNVVACRFVGVRQVRQAAHFDLAEPQSPVPEDELQPLVMLRRVMPITVALTGRRWQQPDLFIVADRLDRTVTECRELADSHCCLTL